MILSGAAPWIPKVNGGPRDRILLSGHEVNGRVNRQQASAAISGPAQIRGVPELRAPNQAERATRFKSGGGSSRAGRHGLRQFGKAARGATLGVEPRG